MLDNLFVLAFLIIQIVSDPIITSPVEGAVLKDVIPITGSTSIEGFQEAALSFTYAQEPIENWFEFASMVDPVTDGLLTQWDTKSITDGDYRLRLQIQLLDGTIKEVIVRDLRIRNYTALPLDESDAAQAAGTPATSSLQDSTQTVIGSSPAPDLPPPMVSPVPLPVNPAALDRAMVFSMVRNSIFVTALVFVILGLFFRSRRNG